MVYISCLSVQSFALQGADQHTGHNIAYRILPESKRQKPDQKMLISRNPDLRLLVIRATLSGSCFSSLLQKKQHFCHLRGLAVMCFVPLL